MNRTFSPPIGVFDSGVGGLSVWREIVRLLPGVDTIYVADQAHIPYGPRPLAEVRRYAEGITRFLLDQGARLIVIACNTASGAALHTLRSRFPDVPFVGMEPAVKPAAERTHTGIVGVIATPATFQGELFRSLVARFASQVDVRTQICPGLVAAVEAEALNTPETVALLRRCLSPLLTAGIDQLVLGCTHYPFLAPTIQQITGPRVDLVDPAPAVARQVRRLLSRHHWLDESRREAEHRFYSTGDAAKLRRAARSLVGYEGRVNSAVWDGDLLRVA